MMAAGKTVKVGIADMNTVKAPDTIRTAGLGSCVGVILYDLDRELAGMIHVMLPDSQIRSPEGKLNEAKFADLAISAMVKRLKLEGAGRLRAKLAGGAQMFQLSGTVDTIRIGPRNIEAVKEQLLLQRISVTAEDTGGSSGRTIEFDPKNGMLNIRTVNAGTRHI